MAPRFLFRFGSDLVKTVTCDRMEWANVITSKQGGKKWKKKNNLSNRIVTINQYCLLKCCNFCTIVNRLTIYVSVLLCYCLNTYLTTIEVYIFRLIGFRYFRRGALFVLYRRKKAWKSNFCRIWKRFFLPIPLAMVLGVVFLCSILSLHSLRSISTSKITHTFTFRARTAPLQFD